MIWVLGEKKKKIVRNIFPLLISVFLWVGFTSSSPLLDTWQLPIDPWFPSTSSAACRENHPSPSATSTVGRGRSSGRGRDLSAHPVAKTLHFQCRGTRFNPQSGNQTPQVATKAWHRHINKCQRAGAGRWDTLAPILLMPVWNLPPNE